MVEPGHGWQVGGEGSQAWRYLLSGGVRWSGEGMSVVLKILVKGAREFHDMK